MCRNIYVFKILVILLSLSISLKSQDINIANWYQNKQGAVVLTFDDWLPSHANIVVEQLQNHQLPATVFVTIQNTKYQKNTFEIMLIKLCHLVAIPDLSKILSDLKNNNLYTKHKSLCNLAFEKFEMEKIVEEYELIYKNSN